MVRVIEQGAPKTCTCYQCKAKLEYVFTDMVFTNESDYTGCQERTARVTCPVCQYRQAVPIHY